MSRFSPVVRQPCMNAHSSSARLWLAAVVAAHLVISIVHGSAHDGAHVPLSPGATLFVFVVILGGPLAGLAVAWRAERTGAWVIAITMAGALIFGFVNHFVLDTPDHVSRVAAPWQLLFGATAVLLGVTEALGVGLAVRLARKTENVP